MFTVGIGEYAITKNKSEKIITHSLGSCVALILYCPNTKHTAMAHIVLPEKSQSYQQGTAINKPGYFADDIVPKLYAYFVKEIPCSPYTIEAHIVGGADSRNLNDQFKVGPRNVEAVSRWLNKYGIRPKTVDVGGYLSRTVTVCAHNGKVKIKTQKMII